jgi:hypothetical protein
VTAQIATIPAPVGGLNALDSLLGMPETDAINLINLVPQAYGLQLRRGYEEHSRGMPAEVKTLAVYNGQDGISKMFGWAGSGMYEVTSAGVVGAPIVTGLSTSRWHTTGMANSGGTQLVAFSGSDDGILYDSSGVHRLVIGDGIVAYTWKNVDPKVLSVCTIHQRRLWAAEEGTCFGWYLPPNQVYGVATLFDFGPLFKRGGSIAGLTTWTVDDGDGADDHLVVVSTEGEVAVYKGTDPNTATAWALTGVYYMGAPVTGHRFYEKVAGDVKFITQQGLVSLNDMLTSTKTTPAQSTIESRKVQQPLAEAATALGSLEGWQLYFAPELNLLFVNVPSVTTLGPIQFVENIVNGAWCEFQNYKASCWCTFDGKHYFGDSNGKVWEAWKGTTDGVLLDDPNGDYIYGACQQAYSYFGKPAAQKQVGLFRPNLVVTANANYGAKIDYDFAFSTATVGSVPPTTDVALWDVALWDHALWSGALKTQRDWSSAQGIGVAASLSIAFRSKAELLWVSTDYTYHNGGPL